MCREKLDVPVISGEDPGSEVAAVAPAPDGHPVAVHIGQLGHLPITSRQLEQRDPAV